MWKNDKNVVGISKNLRNELGQVVDKIESSLKKTSQRTVNQYTNLLLKIEELGSKADSCFRSYLQSPPILMHKKDPLLILQYCSELIDLIANRKLNWTRDRQAQEKQINDILASYNANNIYHAFAKIKIQCLQYTNTIQEQSNQIQALHRRAQASETMSIKMEADSEELLKVYRQNFSKIAKLLEKAEAKETELLQKHRFVSEELQSLKLQFDLYKRNFKKKTIKEERPKSKER